MLRSVLEQHWARLGGMRNSHLQLKCSLGLGACFVMFLFIPLATAQPQYVSIDCGGDRDFTSIEGIQWKTDDASNFNLSRGVAAATPDVDASLRQELQTLRYFPASLSPRRSCYVLPLESPGATYLLRAGFRYGNYDGLNRPPSFLVSLNYDYWAYVQLKSEDDTVYLETITAQQPGVDVTFCLIRVDDSFPPLVNSLELRIIPGGRYLDNVYVAALVDIYLHLVYRVNFGGPFVRYPQDPYDRFWEDYRTVLPELKNVTVIQTSLYVSVAYDRSSTTSVRSEPPVVVMQTALTDPRQLGFSLNPVSQPLLGSSVYHTPPNISSWSNLYFAYFNKSAEQTAVFNFGCTSLFQLEGSSVELPLPRTAAEYFGTTDVDPTLNRTTCTIVKDDPSMVNPIINAAEFFTGQDKAALPTSLPDVQALDLILQSFNLQRLGFGDPCLPTPWDELGCATDSATSLPRITQLDLSGKNLTGSIPASIASLTSLTYLNVSNNRLNGSFPSWFDDLPNLTILDVSNNQLTGSYSKDLASRLGSNFSFSGNKKLCRSNCKGNLTSAITAGVVVGGLCMLAIILAPYLYLTLVSKSSTNGLFDKDYRNLQARLRDQGAKAQPLSLVKVQEATNKFRNKIGQGGFGTVYRGVLKDGQEVAVKVLSGTSKQGKKEFFNEIELLSVVHHKYLVSLVGYCQSWTKQILVYEYLGGGDLAMRLRGESAANNPLGWNDRTAVIVEVAEGLDYLHNGCSPGIIHRDVKSTNILLDAKNSAKVADFGLSRVLEFDRNARTHITTTVKGTNGYLDPDYYISGKLNEKSDVYSYGVVMMELLTGRAPVDSRAEHLFIVDWVLQASQNETVEELVDKNIKNDYDPYIFSELVNLSLWCVDPNSKSRPSMTELLHQLRMMGLETASSSNKCRRADASGLPSDDEEGSSGATGPFSRNLSSGVV